MPQYLSPGVYVEEVPGGSRPIEGVGTAVGAFVGFAESGPFDTPTLVTNWSQFVGTFGEFMAGGYLAHAVYSFFNNGGGSCYVVRIGGNGAAPAPRAAGELMSAARGDIGSYRVEALEEGSAGNEISVEVVTEVGEGEEAAETFGLRVSRGSSVVENFDGLSTRRGPQNVATIVNEQSQLIRIEEIGSQSVADRLPAAGPVQLSGGTAAATSAVTPSDYLGSVESRSGVAGLEAITPITMVSVPDLMAAYQQGVIDLEGVQVVQQAMIDHCENMANRIAIIDPPPGLNAQQVREWRVDKAGYDSAYAALYWPWVKVFDPASAQTIFVPPSGALAGIWGRNDDTRGVHKAPANETVRGAVDIEVNITRAEQDLLNPEGINCIRAFPGRGIQVWGARTLSSDPEWRYLNVRRLFNWIEESILGGTNWAVFEPNDLDLWQRLRRTISAFLLRAWRDGALFGATPEQAFYVKCDEETNPPEVVDAGQVIVEIGVAPVKPAEFVVFRISQFSGGAEISE